MIKLFDGLTEELRHTGSYKTLLEALERDKKHSEEIKVTTARVKQNICKKLFHLLVVKFSLVDIKKLNEEIVDITEERKRDEVSQNDAIQKLKQDLQDLKVKFSKFT